MISTPLVVVTVLMLLPLIPAVIIYYLLTPKRDRSGGRSASARGDGKVGGFRLQFNVLGSSATYVVLLAAASAMYSKLSADELAKIESQERSIAKSMEDRQAWLVELPVLFKNPSNKPIPTAPHQMQQLSVVLEPALTLASATTIQFWVIANNGRFPSATFAAPGQSTIPSVVDLNDRERIAHDYVAHKMSGLGPVWVELGDTYGK
jgi:hypothetical protein